jgi:hypothetical protein
MIANTADVVGANPEVGAFARFADRWIYVFMAALFIVTVLTGFIPDSMNLLAAVEAGERAPLPPILHVHAVLMACWLLLLLTQTTLMATGHRAQHKTLGLIAVVLAPAVVVVVFGVVKAIWSQVAAIPPGVMPPEALSGIKFIVSNILLEQFRAAILFATFIGWALLVRKKDSEMHKRLVIMATLMPLAAAYDRITWLPTTLPDGPASIHLYALLWLLPVLIYDIARRGRVHRAYVIAIALNLPFIITSHLLWGSPWWLATAPRVMGVEGW